MKNHWLKFIACIACQSSYICCIVSPHLPICNIIMCPKGNRIHFLHILATMKSGIHTNVSLIYLQSIFHAKLFTRIWFLLERNSHAMRPKTRIKTKDKNRWYGRAINNWLVVIHETKLSALRIRIDHTMWVFSRPRVGRPRLLARLVRITW